MSKPREGAKAGTLHYLKNKYNGSFKVFEWTGESWSTPGTGWGTPHSLMAVLGWKYVGEKDNE